MTYQNNENARGDKLVGKKKLKSSTELFGRLLGRIEPVFIFLYSITPDNFYCLSGKASATTTPRIKHIRIPMSGRLLELHRP